MARKGLWPTPVAGMADRGDRGDLNTAVKGYPSAGHTKVWPTPKSSPSAPDFARAGREGSGGDDLATAVARTMWPTPTAGDAESSGSRNLPGSKAHAGVSLTDAVKTGDSTTPRWPTPTTAMTAGYTQDEEKRKKHALKGRHQGNELLRQVHEERWPTPQARDWKSGKTLTDYGNSRPLSEQVNGQLSPMWVEWLMGLPIGWTDCEDSATPSSPSAPSGSDTA